MLLDNRRTEILASDYREMLQCIRCGACLNHCPIYAGVGGHAYGWVYPGPMGSIPTPLLTSLEQSKALPNACTSCGRCGEVCPADIPLPELLRNLRHDETRQKLSPPRWRLGLRFHALGGAPSYALPHLTGWAFSPCTCWDGARAASRGCRWRRAGPASGTSPPQGRTFMHQYAALQRENEARAQGETGRTADRCAGTPAPQPSGPDRVAPDRPETGGDKSGRAGSRGPRQTSPG